MSEQKTILEILTMEELELLENLVGKEYPLIFVKTGLSAKATYCLHWILEKRENPSADIEASKKLNLAALNEAIKKYLIDPKAL